MPRKSWNDSYVACPYYRKDDPEEGTIECDGVCDGCVNIMRFQNPDDFQIQMRAFCKDRYRNCEIYETLRRVYEEE